MADVTIDTVTDTLRDAFYVSVGAGVLAFQKIQVQRQELTKAINAQLAEAKDTAEGGIAAAKGSFDNVTEIVEDRVKVLEERLSAIETRLETILAEIETKLPEQAKDLVKQARELVGRAA